MATTTGKINILYRIAEKANKNKKVKPDYVNNENCLRNARNAFPEQNLIVFGDKLTESRAMVREYKDKYYDIKIGDNAKSFMHVFDYAINNFQADDIIYFLEDDYIHRKDVDCSKLIIEGLERADYVSLYDHPDKYNGEPRNLFTTEASHWQFVPSTTMTFAAKVKTLTLDRSFFEYFCQEGNPGDHHIFTELGKQGRRLATPIPGAATHGETQWLSPFTDWKIYVQL